MQKDTVPSLKYIVILLILLIFIYLSFSVLKYFIFPILWALIIAYMTWPIYTLIQRKLGHQYKVMNASIMLVLFMTIFGFPFLIALFTLQKEAQVLFIEAQHTLQLGQLALPSSLQHIPILSEILQKLVLQINTNPHLFIQKIMSWLQAHLNYGGIILSELSQRVFYLFCMLISLFFLYRDGDKLCVQSYSILENLLGERSKPYLKTIAQTTHAVIYGIGFTAFIQSLLAGLSYIFVGLPNTLLITLLTFLFAFIPLGTPICYSSIALWLLSQNQAVSALIIFVWGCCVVTPSSNIIRSLFISKTTNIPFLIIMFGVLGGVTSFGFIGLILGPVILAILLAIWKESFEKSNLTIQNK